MGIPNILFFSTGNEISNSDKIPSWKNSNSYYIESLNKNFLFDLKWNLKRQSSKSFKKKIKELLKSKTNIIITSGAVKESLIAMLLKNLEFQIISKV